MQPGHHHLRRVIGDGEIVREVFGDLIALLFILNAPQLLVAFELEAGSLGRFAAGKIRHLVGDFLQRCALPVKLLRCGLEHLERQNLRLLERPAIVAVCLKDRMLAIDLTLRGLRNVEVDRLDLVEPVGDIAPCNLHPNVGGTLHNIEFAVLQLINHAFGIVADRVEALGDRLVPLAYLHAGDLVAHDFVKNRGLAKRAGNCGDLFRV